MDECSGERRRYGGEVNQCECTNIAIRGKYLPAINDGRGRDGGAYKFVGAARTDLPVQQRRHRGGELVAGCRWTPLALDDDRQQRGPTIQAKPSRGTALAGVCFCALTGESGMPLPRDGN